MAKKDRKGGAPPEPPYWHGHSWQPTGVTWDWDTGRFSDGSPPSPIPGKGPWKPKKGEDDD